MKNVYINTPKAAQYGNDPNGATAARDEAQARMGDNNADTAAMTNGANYANTEAANGRPAVQQDVTAANNQASGANGNQAGAIELARRQAMGQGPSAGAYQLQAGLNQATQQQRAMAAGARGGAALATAGANRNANTANLQQQAFAGAGMLRSQDMANGRGMYASMTGQQRAQDQGAIGMANDFGNANASAADQYQLGMGNAGVGFGGVANAQAGRDLSNLQNSFAPIYAQDDAKQDQQVWSATNRKQAVADNIKGK